MTSPSIACRCLPAPFEAARKIEQQKGRHARVRYFGDANVGFRYFVETRTDANDRWRRTVEEILPWEKNYEKF